MNCLLRLLFILCIPFSGVFAALDIELTQGIVGAIPISIIPTKNNESDFFEIVKNDLQNSGQFRVVNVGESQDVSFWRKKGINAVITGSVESAPTNQYQVSYALIDVFNNPGANATNDTLLKNIIRVNTKELRSSAHHLSDLIYEKLTGTRGNFSTKIAYVLVKHITEKSQYALEIADADGYNPRSLFTSNEPIISPTWSPDGSALAYVSFENHQSAIYLHNIYTGKRRIISRGMGINSAPAFSPDGKKMAMVLTQTDDPNIYLMDLESNKLERITSDWSIDTEPSFSKDGKQLLFTSNRDGSPQIYSYSFEDKTISRMTFQGDYNARAAFMNNENAIVMMHRANNVFGIAKQDLSSGLVQILAESGFDESPSLSPNGKMIIYATQYGNRGILAQVSTDGRIKLRLPSRDGSVQEPTWSPFLTEKSNKK